METIKIVDKVVEGETVKEVEITSTMVRKVPSEKYLQQLKARKTALEAQLVKVNAEISLLEK